MINIIMIINYPKDTHKNPKEYVVDISKIENRVVDLTQ